MVDCGRMTEKPRAAGRTNLSVSALKDISNPDFDPIVADEIAFGAIENPWPIMAEFRRTSPVSVGSYGSVFGAPPDPLFGERPAYTAWTYDIGRQILGDAGLYSSAIVHRLGVEKAFGRILVVMDPPDHTRYRRFLQNALSVKTVRTWTERLIRPLMAELIDDFAAHGSAELVEQYTRRFPFEVVYRLLALPKADVKLFQKLAVCQTFAITPYVKEAIEAGQNLCEYFRWLVEERRRNPGEDLVSHLLFTQVDGENLDEEILLAFLRHLLNAAADTSYRTTGCLLVALLSRPELLAQVRADPELIPPAIEETLRWEGPVASNFRTVTRDHEVAGVRMEEGSVVYVAAGSANRDEAYFADPDVFDIRRQRTVPHLGFGSGPHICVGMHLARLQIKEAVTALLTRLPNLRLDPAAPAPVIRGFHFRAPPELRVVF
jgi:cytochrome P450